MFNVGTANSRKRRKWRKPTTSVHVIRPNYEHFLAPNIQFTTAWRTIKLFTIQLRLVLRLFTFKTPVQSDQALPTCGAALSQLERPFRTYYASSSFPVCMCFFFFYFSAVPLQVWSGPEGSRKLMFPHFMTKAQYGGKVISLTHRPPLPPGNAPGTHFCQRLSRPQGHSTTGRILCQWKIHWHQLGSNQRPSDL